MIMRKINHEKEKIQEINHIKIRHLYYNLKDGNEKKEVKIDTNMIEEVRRKLIILLQKLKNVFFFFSGPTKSCSH